MVLSKKPNMKIQTLSLWKLHFLCSLFTVVKANNRLYDTSWFEDFEYKPTPLADMDDIKETQSSIPISEVPYSVKIQLKEYVNACTMTSACANLKKPDEKMNCIRKCVSPKCYAKVYQFDMYEEGEVDLNFAKFAQCFYTSKMRNGLE